MGKNKRWILTTDSERPIREITKELTAAGFKVGQVHEHIGSVVVAADDDAVPKLKKVRGVVDVSPDSPIDIGPPDEEIS